MKEAQMTKKIGAIKSKIIAAMLEKMIKDKTGKKVKIHMSDVIIETRHDDVKIVMGLEGVVDLKDFNSVAPFLGI
jgi:hypothetical protein